MCKNDKIFALKLYELNACSIPPTFIVVFQHDIERVIVVFCKRIILIEVDSGGNARIDGNFGHIARMTVRQLRIQLPLKMCSGILQFNVSFPHFVTSSGTGIAVDPIHGNHAAHSRQFPEGALHAPIRKLKHIGQQSEIPSHEIGHATLASFIHCGFHQGAPVLHERR